MDITQINDVQLINRNRYLNDVQNDLSQAQSADRDLFSQELRSLSEDKKGLEAAAKKFEGIFLHMMLKSMRSTVNSEDGAFPISKERRMYQEMLDEEMAKDLSKDSYLGLADRIVNQYGKLLEGSTQIQLDLKG